MTSSRLLLILSGLAVSISLFGEGSSLLGHVMAHEVGHILQGTTQHSESGIMRRWTGQDFRDGLEAARLQRTATSIRSTGDY